MPAATVARPARAVPDTARRQPQASHIDLTERNQFAVTKPAPHHSSSHATSLDPEDTTTNSRQARSITERQWVPAGRFSSYSRHSSGTLERCPVRAFKETNGAPKSR